MQQLPKDLQDQLSLESFYLLLLSIFLVLPVILANLCSRARRSGPSLFSTYFLFSSLLCSSLMLITNAEFTTRLLKLSANSTLVDVQNGTAMCWVQGVLLQFSVVAMVFSWLVISFVLKRIVINNEKLLDIMKDKYRLTAAWLIPSIMLTILPFVRNPPEPQAVLPYCWLHNNTVYKLTSFYGWMFLVTVLGGSNIIPVVQKLRNFWSAAMEHDTKTIRDYIRRHTWFFVLFAVVFVAVIQYTLSTGLGISTWYRISSHIFVIALSSIGIMGFLVFGTARALWIHCPLCSLSSKNGSSSHSSFVIPENSVDSLIYEEQAFAQLEAQLETGLLEQGQ